MVRKITWSQDTYLTAGPMVLTGYFVQQWSGLFSQWRIYHYLITYGRAETWKQPDTYMELDIYYKFMSVFFYVYID